MTATTIAYSLAGLIAAGIIFIGARFIIAPRVAAAGYGVQRRSQPAIGRRLSNRQRRPRHRIGAVRLHPHGRGRDAPTRLDDTGRHHHSDRRRDHRARQRRPQVNRLRSPWPQRRRHAHDFCTLAYFLGSSEKSPATFTDPQNPAWRMRSSRIAFLSSKHSQRAAGVEPATSSVGIGDSDPVARSARPAIYRTTWHKQ